MTGEVNRIFTNSKIFSMFWLLNLHNRSIISICTQLQTEMQFCKSRCNFVN